MAYLVVRSGQREVHRGELRDALIIGRAPECDIQLLDPRISRMHCRIDRDGNDWVVIDLGSSNGTFAKGEKVERHVLIDGGSFEIGDERVIFHADEMMAPRPAHPDDSGIDHSDSTIWPATNVNHVDGTLVAVNVAVRTPRGIRSDAT